MPWDCPYYCRCRRSPGCTCRPLAPSPLSHVSNWTHLIPLLLSAVYRSYHSDVGKSCIFGTYLLPVLPLHSHLDRLLPVLVYHLFLHPYNCALLQRKPCGYKSRSDGQTRQHHNVLRLSKRKNPRLHREIRPGSPIIE